MRRRYQRSDRSLMRGIFRSPGGPTDDQAVNRRAIQNSERGRVTEPPIGRPTVPTDWYCIPELCHFVLIAE